MIKLSFSVSSLFYFMTLGLGTEYCLTTKANGASIAGQQNITDKLYFINPFCGKQKKTIFQIVSDGKPET